MTEPYRPTVSAGAGSSAADLHRAQPETIGGAVSALTSDLSTLMRQEVALAKAEVRKSATEAGKGIGMLVGAGIAGVFLLMFLSISLWWAIGNHTGRGWAALIVAAIWLIIALILLSVGRKQLKQVQGVPQTTDSLAKVPNALKGNEEENR